MSQVITGVLVKKEPEWQNAAKREEQTACKIRSPESSKNADAGAAPYPEMTQQPAPIPKSLVNISQRELKFFTEPKRVRKKTQKSIFAFQLTASLILCLIMLLSRMAAPQLYDNLHAFLTRIFL
ncbi:MAG: hypothetical protein NC203_03780 [Firmicutes bacterium]|nr:hypothetical protein [[Eubacterium] siraeum]MCM1487467.1 hypothetical protein [Bacillota bacterium]